MRDAASIITSDKVRVLLVDDEPDAMEITSLYLKDADPGFSVDTEADPVKALQLCKDHPYDCVVSDYQMPNMNGIQFTMELRKISDVPIIIYTGRGSEEVASAAFSAGADDYVRKEKELSHYKILAKRIRQAVERYQLKEALSNSSRIGISLPKISIGSSHLKKMPTPRLVVTVALIIGGTILLSGIYFNSNLIFPGQRASIRIGAASHEVNTLIYVAENRGYFTANGLDVTIVPSVSGLSSLEAMLKGEVDVAGAAEYVSANKILGNDSFYTLATIDKMYDVFVIARKDSGISQITDLAGKKIGVSKGTAQDFVLAKFLETSGVATDKVTLINIPPQLAPVLLANATVDAAITWEPYANTIQNNLGTRVIVWEAQQEQFLYWNLCSKISWAKDHPDLIVRLLRSLNAAESYVVNNPDQSRSIIQRELNYSKDYTEKIWTEHKFFLTLDQSMILAMQDEARWLIRNRLLGDTKVPDFQNYIYFDGMRAVSPETLSVIG